jgi:ABC-type antimicrobial peptide transport system permease subunit
MCSIEPLKKIFEGEEGISFVDNEEVFKSAVLRDGYCKYFIDIFGGDFGHCTDKGNRLLAENIANVILKEVFHK